MAEATIVKDAPYHEAAVVYNTKMADFTAELADSIDHPVIKQWCKGISKQHTFHANRHQKSLDKMSGVVQEVIPEVAAAVETKEEVDA